MISISNDIDRERCAHVLVRCTDQIAVLPTKKVAHHLKKIRGVYE